MITVGGEIPMQSYLENLIHRMSVDKQNEMKDGTIRNSSETTSWKAYREAEVLTDPAYSGSCPS